MVQTSDLLTIQKFIYLLDDFHYQEYTTYLTDIKAHLPLKLSQHIRKKLPGFDNHEGLCKKIYGGYEKNDRLNFNQLASYSFKLSSNLAINYPSYLSPNYSLLQRLINTGDIEPANFLGKVLLDIAEKTEDHSTRIFVLKFFIQQAFLMKDNAVGVKFTHALDEAYEYEKICNDILSALRLHLNIALNPAVAPEKLEEYKQLFKSYHGHPSSTVRLLGKYAYIYTIYYHDSEQFKDESTSKLLEDLDKDIDNNPHVVFPFAFDLKSNFNFYKLNKLNFLDVDLNSKESRKEFEELRKHYSSVKFWNSYLNIPEMFAMALKTSVYLNMYHHLVHRSDYYNIIPAEELKEINGLAAKCKEMLSNKGLEKYYKNDLINLELVYSGLLILSGGNGVKKGAEELESMLISYQQINLAGTADSIFLFLMIAYFSMRAYDKCASTFKRFIRITKGKPVYEDNTLEIHACYYLSQWLLNKNKQYLLKLKATYEKAVQTNPQSVQVKAIEEYVSYFGLPIDL
jgi:hypothetical protein